MNKHTITLLLCFTTILASAQEKRTFIYAEIADKVALLPDVHVLNLQTKQGTFTNENGEFRVLAKENDSLQLSYVGYETKIWVVKKNHFGIHKNSIELNKISISLDEVEVKKNSLLGYLDADSKLIKEEKVINAVTLKLPFAGSRILTKAERELHTATSSYGGIPLDPFLNWISGRLKKLKQNKHIEELENRIHQVKTNYSEYILNELTIKETDVYRFIYFSETDQNFSIKLKQGKVAMIDFLLKKSIEFKKLNPENYQ